MTRKTRRLTIVLIAGLSVGSALVLTLFAFRSNIVFFVSPADLAASSATGRYVRVGGIVEGGSVKRQASDGRSIMFNITDGKSTIKVVYHGIVPDLFREGQGVVALGSKQGDGVFHASEVLAKHDETYMPRDVVEALKKSGRWSDGGNAPASASEPTASQGSKPRPGLS